MAQYSCAQADGDREVRLAERERDLVHSVINAGLNQLSPLRAQGSLKKRRRKRLEVTDGLADFKEPLNPAEVMHLGTQRDCGGPERELQWSPPGGW